MGYRPNPVAINLKYGHTNTVGVIVPEMVTPFASRVINGIQEVLHTKNIKVIIAESGGDPEKEKENLQLMEGFMVDGIIICLCSYKRNKEESTMINWNNLDTLTSFKELSEVERVNLAEVMSGENGAERVKDYSVPMTEDLTYNYAAKAVDDKVLAALAKLAKEAQLTEKYAALYNGEVINTGEKRLVLHQLTRGQLGDKVEADGVDKREFYVKQQQRIADFANKVHAGEITNAAG